MPLKPTSSAACIISFFGIISGTSNAHEPCSNVALCCDFGAPPTFTLCRGHLVAELGENGLPINLRNSDNMDSARSCTLTRGLPSRDHSHEPSQPRHRSSLKVKNSVIYLLNLFYSCISTAGQTPRMNAGYLFVLGRQPSPSRLP